MKKQIQACNNLDVKNNNQFSQATQRLIDQRFQKVIRCLVL